MSLGCYPFLPGAVITANLGEDVITPAAIYPLPTSAGFSNNSYVQVGLLSTGTVKIVYGYITYSYGATGSVGDSISMDQQDATDFYQTTDAISTVIIGPGMPVNTDVTLSIDGEIVPLVENPPASGEESQIVTFQQDIPEEYQSQIQFSNIDITDPQNNETILTIQSLSEKIPEPGNPSLTEPIPDGEYEPVNVNDFENAITPGQDTVITLDPQTDTYLAIPESDTVVISEVPGTLDQPETSPASLGFEVPQFVLPFGFNSQPFVINSSGSNAFSFGFNSEQGMYNTLQFTVNSTGSNTATLYFLAIGI